MRKTQDQSIKDAIKQMLDTYHLTKRYEVSSIGQLWPNLVGAPIANRTQEIFIKNKVLFLRIDSAVVKNEIQRMRTNLLMRINEQFGHELVVDIRFL